MAVTIHLEDHPDERSAYREVTEVTVDILVDNEEAGKIEALILDRRRIPKGYFYSAFDGHSADMQWVGCAMMEPKYGRTQLRSLAEYDDPKFKFMYISIFHVDEAHKANNSDVATTALRQFLHHPFISFQEVSSVAYILDSREAMRKEGINALQKFRDSRPSFLSTLSPHERVVLREKEKEWEDRRVFFSRQDANPFLRNGFFQDEAIAKSGNPSILVASKFHFGSPLKTHAEALAVRFRTPDPPQLAATGKSAELFEYMLQACATYEYEGKDKDIATVRKQIRAFLEMGASLADSKSLHVAVANNAFDVVKLVLEMDTITINWPDGMGNTPLMVAAVKAAGRNTKDGIPETKVIDLLLSKGASKSLQSTLGLTAYGYFKDITKEYGISTQAMCGRTTGSRAPNTRLSERAVLAKLMPPGGPSPYDLTGDNNDGIIDYFDNDEDDYDKKYDDDYD